ncbi:hypothetical protein F1880_009658 [Penicillium rolfsii]|nr:hypothetical protein F1880_009658 [Penicillium rolfsii]
MGSISPSTTLDFYSSPYLAEHYDLLCAHEGAFFTDIDVFHKELVAVHDRKNRHGRVAIGNEKDKEDPNALVVVDVGTGTGRALFELAQRARTASPSLDLTRAHFLGFDLSPDMVARAARTRDLAAAFVGTVQWRCASALELDAVVTKSGLSEGQVDLLIFADGGFLHLETEAEAQQFLEMVAKMLRPQIGRAVLAITNQASVREGKDLSYHDASGTKVQEYASVEFPGLVYRNRLVQFQQDGALQESTYRFEVWQPSNGDKGEEKELVDSWWTRLKGRAWLDAEVQGLIEACSGLRLVEMSQPDRFQTFFIISAE